MELVNVDYTFFLLINFIEHKVLILNLEPLLVRLFLSCSFGSKPIQTKTRLKIFLKRGEKIHDI
jgi:hypothetical protein